MMAGLFSRLSMRVPAAVLSLVLLACSSGCAQREAPFNLSNIGGLMPDLEFRMRDENGRNVVARDYLGKVVLLYFGYTRCPDACPTTLTTLSQAVSLLGNAGTRVRVLFVTVDPQRDTTGVLKQYVSAFGREFTGLRGDDAALSQLTRRYRVAYRLEPPDADGNYAVDHSSAVFVFDSRGRARLLANAGDTAKAIASDLKRLIPDA